MDGGGIKEPLKMATTMPPDVTYLWEVGQAKSAYSCTIPNGVQNARRAKIIMMTYAPALITMQNPQELWNC
jgi:hypothetical protein